MIEFNAQQKKQLKSLGNSSDGANLKVILETLKKDIMDVSNITDNYDVQVEARKIVKALITKLQDAMTEKKNYGGSDDVDEYE